jgi:polysaccharide biosynthesis transport protein
MELKQYLALARRWSWLLAISLVIGAVAGYVWSLYQTPMYEASTRILITRAPQDKTSDMTALSDPQMTQTYVQLLSTQPVIDAASLKLNTPLDPKRIKVKPILNTQIIQVTFDDHDPVQAALAANTLVQVLISQNEVLQSGRYADTEASLQAQIKTIQAQIDSLQSQINNASSQAVQDQLTQVQTQIASLQGEVSTLQQDIQAHTPGGPLGTPAPGDQARVADDRARLSQIQPVLSLYQQVYTNLVVLGQPVNSASSPNGTRLAQLQTTLGLYQQIYINLLNNLETVQLAKLQNTPNVVQIEPASVPSEPIQPRPLLDTALAAVLALLLAGGTVFLIEYLDDTLKTPEDIERHLGLPVIGWVANIEYSSRNAKEICVLEQPRSPISEAFRLLRTNLEFSGVDKPLHTILVTSAGPGEGKTTVSVNLAASIAQGGKSVILLDTDLRRPQIHTFFDLPNHVGFSDLFRSGNLSFRMVGSNFGTLKDALVITSGNPPSNPTELLGSSRMNQLLASLKSAAEVVVLDSPPSVVADAQILAAKVDGVLLVIHPGHTRIDSAIASAEQMKRAGARILGVIMNRIPRNGSYYYGRYDYHYLPYYSTKKSQPATADALTAAVQPALSRAQQARQAVGHTLKGVASWIKRRKGGKVRLNSEFDWSNRKALPAGRAQDGSLSLRQRTPVQPAGQDIEKPSKTF